jgi:hypothetical protein
VINDLRRLTARWSGATAMRRGAAPLLGTGTALVVVLHFLRPDVHPGRHYISEYGNDTWWWVLSLALLLIATGLFALAATLLESSSSRTAPRLLQGAGGLLIVSAVMSTDRTGGEVVSATLSGKVHGVAAIGAFGLLAASMVALSHRVYGPGTRLGSAGAWALPLAALAVGLAATTFMLVPDAHGIRQRLFLAIVFAWLLVTSRQLSSSEPGPISPQLPGPEPGPIAAQLPGPEPGPIAAPEQPRDGPPL